MSGLKLDHNQASVHMQMHLRFQQQVKGDLPDILDGNTAISLLAPHSQRVDQQDDELPILHPDGNDLSVRTVGRALGRMAQTYLV